jgi:malonyl CoA-acyl carrier protein transacylase
MPKKISTRLLYIPHYPHQVYPVIGNVNAAPLSTIEEIRSDLQAQLTHRVRWTESIEYMISNGVRNFMEIGNGNVLSGLVKRINRDAIDNQSGRT